MEHLSNIISGFLEMFHVVYSVMFEENTFKIETVQDKTMVLEYNCMLKVLIKNENLWFSTKMQFS